MDEEQTLITDVHLAYQQVDLAKRLWDVRCLNGRVLDIVPSNSQVGPPLMTAGHCTVIQGNGGTLLPS